MKTVYLSLVATSLLGLAGCSKGPDNGTPTASVSPPGSTAGAAEQKPSGGGGAAFNAKNMTLGPGSAQFGSKAGGG